jgi:hypothetical protein
MTGDITLRISEGHWQDLIDSPVSRMTACLLNRNQDRVPDAER